MFRFQNKQKTANVTALVLRFKVRSLSIDFPSVRTVTDNTGRREYVRGNYTRRRCDRFLNRVVYVNDMVTRRLSVVVLIRLLFNRSCDFSRFLRTLITRVGIDNPQTRLLFANSILLRRCAVLLAIPAFRFSKIILSLGGPGAARRTRSGRGRVPDGDDVGTIRGHEPVKENDDQGRKRKDVKKRNKYRLKNCFLIKRIGEY